MAQLLSNLPIGAKVKFGKHSVNGETAQDIIWLVVAMNHSGYPTNSVTLLTNQIIDVRCFDAVETSNPLYSDRSNGNIDYGLSNIDQWLNKDTYNWYVASHAYDQSPDSTNVAGLTHYASRPGFLHAFTPNEKAAILATTIISARYVGNNLPYAEYWTRNVFLPSYTEIKGVSVKNVYEGTRWSYFADGGDESATWTSQAQSYVAGGVVRSGNYWSRSSESIYGTYLLGGVNSSSTPHTGSIGIRPALNVSSTLKISDTMDSDGCYTFIWNTAPSVPSNMSVPTIYGGKSNSISWGNAIDAEGDTITYQLECSIDGGNYAQIYSGTSTTYAHLVPFGTTSVAYRVKATDTSGESSAYTTSNTVTVINNNAPVISGADTNLGVKSVGFTGTYKIEDANNDIVTITEAIDGVQIRSLVATLGEEITYGVTENTWLALANGSHTLTIRATDGIDTTVRTLVFTKLVDTLKIQNATPWASATMPSRIMLVVTRNIPSGATFKVEVCNNGHDTYPMWEDATDAVRSGLVHVFANKIKTAGSWGVLVRVTVERNGATGACYVSAIGGNFE